MRRTLIAGNWKMHKTVPEAVDLVHGLLGAIRGVDDLDVVIAPPFTALEAVTRALSGSSVELAAQNMHGEPQGAFTGEISAPMLVSLGVRYVILGHSERRQHFGETDTVVGHKVACALAHGLTPILCVGETLEQRDAGSAFQVVEEQLRGALQEAGADALPRTVVAYEPVWAIGTGRTASADQAQEIHAHLRDVVASLAGAACAEEVRLVYGGSVKPDNIAGLMERRDVDGALVGGASLDAETFASLVRFRV